MPQYSPYQQQQFPNLYPPSNPNTQPIILSQSAYTNDIGTVHIVGEVMNESPVVAHFVKVIVTFYNAYNQVIGTDFTFTEPHDLAPGQRAPFDISITSGSMPINQARNYALSIENS